MFPVSPSWEICAFHGRECRLHGENASFMRGACCEESSEAACFSETRHSESGRAGSWHATWQEFSGGRRHCRAISGAKALSWPSAAGRAPPTSLDSSCRRAGGIDSGYGQAVFPAARQKGAWPISKVRIPHTTTKRHPQSSHSKALSPGIHEIHPFLCIRRCALHLFPQLGQRLLLVATKHPSRQLHAADII